MWFGSIEHKVTGGRANYPLVNKLSWKNRMKETYRKTSSSWMSRSLTIALRRTRSFSLSIFSIFDLVRFHLSLCVKCSVKWMSPSRSFNALTCFDATSITIYSYSIECKENNKNPISFSFGVSHTHTHTLDLRVRELKQFDRTELNWIQHDNHHRVSQSCRSTILGAIDTTATSMGTLCNATIQRERETIERLLLIIRDGVNIPVCIIKVTFFAYICLSFRCLNKSVWHFQGSLLLAVWPQLLLWFLCASTTKKKKRWAEWGEKKRLLAYKKDIAERILSDSLFAAVHFGRYIVHCTMTNISKWW